MGGRRELYPSSGYQPSDSRVAKPELVVISECFWTAAAKHADIVLPATTSYERNDLTMTGDYSNQHLAPMKQVVSPRWEARNDFDVLLN